MASNIRDTTFTTIGFENTPPNTVITRKVCITDFAANELDKSQLDAIIPKNDDMKAYTTSESEKMQSTSVIIGENKVTTMFPTHNVDNELLESMPLATDNKITLVSQNVRADCNISSKRKKNLPSHFSDYIGFQIGNSEIHCDIKAKNSNKPKMGKGFSTAKKYNTRKRKFIRKKMQLHDNFEEFNINKYKYDLPQSFKSYEGMRNIEKDNTAIKNNIKVIKLVNITEDARKISNQNRIGLNRTKCGVCQSSIEGSKLIGPPLSNLLPCTQLTGHQFLSLLGVNLSTNNEIKLQNIGMHCENRIENSVTNGIHAGEPNNPKQENICDINHECQQNNILENVTQTMTSDFDQICKRCFNFIKKGDQAYRQLYNAHKEIIKIHLHGQNENLFRVSSLNGKVEANDEQIVQHEKINFCSDEHLISNENVEKPLPKIYNIITGKYQEDVEKKNYENIESNIKYISLSDSMHQIIETKPLYCIYCKETYSNDNLWKTHLNVFHNINSNWCSVSKFSNFNKLLSSEVNLNLQNYICIACKRCDFLSKDIFICHLLNEHRIDAQDLISCKKTIEILCQEPSVDVIHGHPENSNPKEAEQVMITIRSEPNVDSPEIKSITKTPKVITGKKFDVAKFWNCEECSNKFISEDALNNHSEIVGHYSPKHIKKEDTNLVIDNSENQIMQCIKNVETHKETKIKTKRNRSNREIYYKKKRKGKSICLKLNKANMDESINDIDKKIISLEKNILNNTEDNLTSVDVQSSVSNEINDITSIKDENIFIQKPHVEVCQNNDIITHELIVLECEECGSRFLNHTALGLHMTRIHGRPRKLHKVFTCHKCDFKAPTNGKLKIHLKTLHDIDNLDKAQCHECGGFYTPNFIKKHIENMHSNKLEHVCKFCNMKFRAMYLMKAHIASEHLNNRWRCDICDQEFDKYHRMRMHKIHQHQTSSLLCTQCDKTFKRKGDLTAHMKRAHMEKEEFKCMYCPRSYLDKGKYRNHLINKHNIPWHKTLSKNYCKILRENNMLKVPPMRKKTNHSRDLNDDQERAAVAEAVGYLEAIEKEKLDGEVIQNEEQYDIIEVILENQ